MLNVVVDIKIASYLYYVVLYKEVAP